jgi:hypothetical protein
MACRKGQIASELGVAWERNLEVVFKSYGKAVKDGKPFVGKADY